MRTLTEDRDEMNTDAERRWVARLRREYGIAAHESATWVAQVEGERLDTGDTDWAIVELGYSPGDVLWGAEVRAWNAARRDGLGRWTLEVFGDGVNAPTVLRVRPIWDDVDA